MANELRCPGHLWAKVESGLIEVRCRYCSKGRGAVVFHYFDPKTGSLVRTELYADPDKTIRMSARRQTNERTASHGAHRR